MAHHESVLNLIDPLHGKPIQSTASVLENKEAAAVAMEVDDKKEEKEDHTVFASEVAPVVRSDEAPSAAPASATTPMPGTEQRKELDAEIENMTKDATENKGELKKVLNTPQARESIEQTLLARKTIQRLTEAAQGSKKTKRTKKGEGK